MSRKKRPDRGADATGKSRLDAKHIRLYAQMLDSPAYLALSCGARALLIELTKLYNGSNNGRIALGVRQAAARLGCGKTKAIDYFDELLAKGFIKATGKGTFNSKGGFASEWTLTDYPTMGQPTTPPTRDYRQWAGIDFPTPKRAPRKTTLSRLLAAEKQNLGSRRVDAPFPTCGQGVPDARTLTPEAFPTCGHFQADRGVKRSQRVDTHSYQAQGTGERGNGERVTAKTRKGADVTDGLQEQQHPASEQIDLEDATAAASIGDRPVPPQKAPPANFRIGRGFWVIRGEQRTAGRSPAKGSR